MPPSLFRWATPCLAAVGLGLSIYLTAVSLGTAPAVGCDFTSEADCGAALASRWAKWLGAPVAAGGVLVYAAALAGSLLAGRGDAGWRLLEGAAVLAIGAGVWFVFVQIAWLEGFCPWCLATHGCGLLMAVAALLWRRAEANDDDPAPTDSWAGDAPVLVGSGPPPLGPAAVGGLLGVVVLILGQAFGGGAAPVVIESPKLDASFALSAATPDPSSETPKVEPAPESESKPEEEDEQPKTARAPRRRSGGSREVKLLDGQLTLDTYKHALLGSPDAPHVVVELMDYACPHCREFHEVLTETVERFDGRVAVVVLPVPNEITCNPYVKKGVKQTLGACFTAKLALAVAEVSPEKFEPFHRWALGKESMPQRVTSLIEARRLVDGDDLSNRLRDGDGGLAAQIQRNVALAAAVARQGKFTLPCQIVEGRILLGKIDTSDELAEQWADAFGLDGP